MTEPEHDERRGVRAFLVTGLGLVVTGGVVVAATWSVSTATVLAGSLLVGAGQFLVMLALAVRRQPLGVGAGTEARGRRPGRHPIRSQ